MMMARYTTLHWFMQEDMESDAREYLNMHMLDRLIICLEETYHDDGTLHSSKIFENLFLI